MKQIEIRLRTETVAPLLGTLRQAGLQARSQLAMQIRLPAGDDELAPVWKAELLAGQSQDVRVLLDLFENRYVRNGTVVIEADIYESVLRACAAMRIHLHADWLGGLPQEVLEDEDSRPEDVPPEQRTAFNCYLLLGYLQRIVLQNFAFAFEGPLRRT